MNHSKFILGLKSRLSSETWATQVATVTVVIAAIILVVFGPESFLYQICAVLAFALFAFGSAIWIHKKIRNFPIASVPGFLKNVFHISVIFGAAIPARLVVSESTGLPPQDFDLSVALITGLMYVPIWLGAFGVFLLLLAIGQISLSALRSVVSSPIRHIVVLFKIEHGAVHRWAFGQLKESTRLFKLAIGTYFLFAVTAVVSALLMFFIVRQSDFVRLVAYYADFQTMHRYPCIKNDQRVRLHENGVASVATRNGLDVTIKIEVLDVAKCVSEGS